ncbi:MAG: sulfite exporter TauE/SafE family protein [Verrucomicrobiota bacterium]
MTILIAAAILAFCALVQGAAGFAFSLFAVPLLLFTGYDFPNAVALTLLASLLQKFTMIYHLRRSIQRRGLLVPALFMLLMLPFGVLALRMLGSSGSGVVKRVVGGLVLAVLMIRWLLKVEPHSQVHWGWGALAGGFSGFFQGLANVGGPPIVLWSQAHRWPPERLRSVTPVLVVLLAPFQIFMLNLAVGNEVWPDWKQMVFFAPVIMSAAFAGVWLGGHLRVDRLRFLVTVLLLLLSFMLLLNPLAFLKR